MTNTALWILVSLGPVSFISINEEAEEIKGRIALSITVPYYVDHLFGHSFLTLQSPNLIAHHLLKSLGKSVNFVSHDLYHIASYP